MHLQIGWTLFQRRGPPGDVSFKRNWQDFKHGFGDLQGEHWLGNKYLYSLTSFKEYLLRIELTDWTDTQKHALYANFRVGPEWDGYKIYFDRYLEQDSTVADSLTPHRDAKFSTYDRDNDGRQATCAATHGGFWLGTV